jgi:hypothetical protein
MARTEFCNLVSQRTLHVLLQMCKTDMFSEGIVSRLGNIVCPDNCCPDNCLSRQLTLSVQTIVPTSLSLTLFCRHQKAKVPEIKIYIIRELKNILG